MSAKPKPEVCDTCGKRRKVRFSNPLRAFCSAECANAYLISEGFLPMPAIAEPEEKTP